LSLNELRDYQKIIPALNETIALMEQIDEAIEEHEGGLWSRFLDSFHSSESLAFHSDCREENPNFA